MYEIKGFGFISKGDNSYWTSSCDFLQSFPFKEGLEVESWEDAHKKLREKNIKYYLFTLTPKEGE